VAHVHDDVEAVELPVGAAVVGAIGVAAVSARLFPDRARKRARADSGGDALLRPCRVQIRHLGRGEQPPYTRTSSISPRKNRFVA
jgi:hypothetical protein